MQIYYSKMPQRNVLSAYWNLQWQNENYQVYETVKSQYSHVLLHKGLGEIRVAFLQITRLNLA